MICFWLTLILIVWARYKDGGMRQLNLCFLKHFNAVKALFTLDYICKHGLKLTGILSYELYKFDNAYFQYTSQTLQ